MKSDHLWFLYQQGIELTARFDLYLDEVAGLCAPTETGLVGYFRDQLKPIRDKLEVGITDLAQSPDEAEVECRRTLTHLAAYQLAAAGLQNLHWELRFFPVQPPVPPEVYVFLTDFFPLSSFSKIQPVVTYFPDHNFEQLDMHTLQKGDEAQVVLRMPYVEFRNPLMWTNLIHEMGHALDESYGFTDVFVEHLVALGERDKTVGWAVVEKDKTVNWASEFYADRVAIQLAGPAYLCAFITWHLTRDPKKLGASDKTHPPASERALVMKEHLQSDTHLKKWSFLLDVFRAFQELPVDLPAPRRFMAEEARSYVTSMTSDRRLIPCSEERLLSAKDILDALHKKTPVSSLCKTPQDEIEDLLNRMNSSEFRNAEEFYSAIGVMQEEPNSSCAIINAAWEWKLGKGLEEFHTIFSAKDGEFMDSYRSSKSDFDERYKTCKHLLLGFETRLRKSIEVAKLHKLWQAAEQRDQKESRASIKVPEGSNPEENLREGTAVPSQVLETRKSGAGPAPPEVETNPSPLLSEKEIIRRLLRNDRYRLVVTPILNLRSQIQPTSVDLRLGTEFELIKSALFDSLNVLEAPEKARARVAQYMEKVHVRPDQPFVLHPGEFALGSTLEYFKLPSDLAGRLDGKSTWGRVGLQIHSTAGFVDPGFEGALTFELQNVGRVPIPLYPGMRVAQICFFKCEKSSIPYSEKRDALYGGNPGLLSTQFFKLPDQKLLRYIQEDIEAERNRIEESRKK